MHDVKRIRRENDEQVPRCKFSIRPTPRAKSRATVLQTIARLLVFNDPRVMTLQKKGNYIIRSLFEALCNDRKLLPLDFQQLLNKKLASQERLVCDFIAGMTDRYASAYYSRLFLPGFGSFYEDV